MFIYVPDHYDIECIDGLRSALSEEEFRGFCKGIALKYLWQSDRSPKDLRKAIWYIRMVDHQGFVPFRMTLAQRDAIPEPVAGMLVEDPDGQKSSFNGTRWIRVGSEGQRCGSTWSGVQCEYIEGHGGCHQATADEEEVTW